MSNHIAPVPHGGSSLNVFRSSCVPLPFVSYSSLRGLVRLYNHIGYWSSAAAARLSRPVHEPEDEGSFFIGEIEKSCNQESMVEIVWKA
jgi:hypothetical protein